jgi:hypothetical protein
VDDATEVSCDDGSGDWFDAKVAASGDDGTDETDNPGADDGSDEPGDDDGSTDDPGDDCSTDDLTVGAVVSGASVEVDADGAYFAGVELAPAD